MAFNSLQATEWQVAERRVRKTKGKRMQHAAAQARMNARKKNHDPDAKRELDKEAGHLTALAVKYLAETREIENKQEEADDADAQVRPTGSGIEETQNRAERLR